jgi:5-dehydro-2-deoxygluconokinase
MSSSVRDPLEILTVGRVSVDLYAEQLSANASQVQSFRKSIGGTTTNVAVAAARLGHRVATCTRVGDDEFGEYIMSTLSETFGVDTRFIKKDSLFKTPLAFVFRDPPEDPRVVFYREPRAPDMNIVAADVDATTVAEVPIFWMAGSNLAYEPCRTAMHELLGLRNRLTSASSLSSGPSRIRHTILDLDWRPMFWKSATHAAAEIVPIMNQFSMVIGNRAECEIVVGTNDPGLALDRLLGFGLDAAVVKLGGDGVLVGDRYGLRELVAPIAIDVVCGVGAGDAFGAALCHGILEGWNLDECARFGNAAGALVAARLMCADDMPTLGEITALTNHAPR